tara:strand:- start:515 stop:703 length:189 start_codon:yes stop_codon:yes gene_type:complete
MEFEAVFKIVVGAIISLVIAGFASMSENVTANKVKIDGLQNSVKRTEKMVNDIHWHFIRGKK